MCLFCNFFFKLNLLVGQAAARQVGSAHNIKQIGKSSYINAALLCCSFFRSNHIYAGCIFLYIHFVCFLLLFHFLQSHPSQFKSISTTKKKKGRKRSTSNPINNSTRLITIPFIPFFPISWVNEVK